MKLLNALIESSMGMFAVLMLSVCLYFILSYFEYLKQEDKRLIKQSKFFAVITLLLALGVPAIF